MPRRGELCSLAYKWAKRLRAWLSPGPLCFVGSTLCVLVYAAGVTVISFRKYLPSTPLPSKARML